MRATISASPLGFQTLVKAMATATLTTAAMSSVRLNSGVAETIHLTMPKVTPTTRPKGQHSLTPFLPSMTARSRKGTTRHRMAVSRPVVGEIESTFSNPPTAAAWMTGSPTAPKATGTVLASRAMSAARIGEKPTATSMAAAMATGAPKPARASRRPPKQKAISRPSTRGSSLIRKKVLRRSSNRPEITVTWYIQMAINRIHTIGNKPYTNPWKLDETAIVTGILNARMATTKAKAQDTAPAMCAFQRNAPRVTSMHTMGMTATRAESHCDPSGSAEG